MDDDLSFQLCVNMKMMVNGQQIASHSFFEVTYNCNVLPGLRASDFYLAVVEDGNSAKIAGGGCLTVLGAIQSASASLPDFVSFKTNSCYWQMACSVC